jgi:CheY-like chemotaxis protein
VTLPAVIGAQAAYTVPDMRGLAVMVVSLQAIEASLIARRLGAWGAPTCVMTDTEAALALLPGRIWHAVIVDHALPPADVQRIGQAAQRHAGRCVIMIAPADRHALESLKLQGFGDYLVKPLRSASLAARLAIAPTEVPIVPDETNAFPPAVAKKPERSLSVLVAEDNEINALLTRSLLLRLGHRPVVASNGAEAVDSWIAAESAGAPYDVILMDVQMPLLDGIEATRQIRTREAGRGGRRTPVLALTANTLVEDRYAGFQAGMDGYLIKPLDRERLTEALAGIAPAASVAA